MLPKCSLDAQNIATLREHLANIPRILRAGWVICIYIYMYIYIYMFVLIEIEIGIREQIQLIVD